MNTNGTYLKSLGMTLEPFGLEADPDMLYLSDQHADCMEKVEVAIRLRRGLVALSGDIGTGKTSLSNRLARTFTADGHHVVRTISDPSFESEATFRRCLYRLFTGKTAPAPSAAWSIKDALAKVFAALSKKGKCPVLFIDEAQKLNDPKSLSVLHEMANLADADGQKLVQIVLFGQNELDGVLRDCPALSSRVSEHVHLDKMVLFETRDMLRFRLSMAGCPDPVSTIPDKSCKLIHDASAGFPRMTVKIAHQCLLRAVNSQSSSVSPALVRDVLKTEFSATCDMPNGKLPIMERLPVGRIGVTKTGIAAVVAIAVLLCAVASYRLWVPGMESANASVASVPVAFPTVSRPASGAVAPTRTDGAAAKDVSPGDNAEVPETVAPQSGREDDRPSAKREETDLGFVLTGDADTLSGIMAGVYGAYREAMVDDVMTANPGMTDPNALPPGRLLRMPRIVGDKKWAGRSVSVFSRHDTLGDAWYALSGDRRGKRILAVKREGKTLFLVVARSGDADSATRFAISPDDVVYGI